MELTLYRDFEDKTCTLGIITNGVKNLHTMERPDVPSPLTVAGTKGRGRIAAGRYRLERHNSEAHPNVWALVNHALDIYHWEHEVPVNRKGIARTVVLIHPANVAEELRGCIAPGLTRGRRANGDREVLSSRDAMNQLRNWIGGSLDNWLTITEERIKR